MASVTLIQFFFSIKLNETASSSNDALQKIFSTLGVALYEIPKSVFIYLQFTCFSCCDDGFKCDILPVINSIFEKIILDKPEPNRLAQQTVLSCYFDSSESVVLTSCNDCSTMSS